MAHIFNKERKGLKSRSFKKKPEEKSKKTLRVVKINPENEINKIMSQFSSDNRFNSPKPKDEHLNSTEVNIEFYSQKAWDLGGNQISPDYRKVADENF